MHSFPLPPSSQAFWAENKIRVLLAAANTSTDASNFMTKLKLMYSNLLKPEKMKTTAFYYVILVLRLTTHLISMTTSGI